MLAELRLEQGSHIANVCMTNESNLELGHSCRR
jgi:hypothetical protein